MCDIRFGIKEASDHHTPYKNCVQITMKIAYNFLYKTAYKFVDICIQISTNFVCIIQVLFISCHALTSPGNIQIHEHSGCSAINNDIMEKQRLQINSAH